MKDNKLIAEFMGVFHQGIFPPVTIGKQMYTLDELQYHTSWDWLMPVVNKIEMGCEGVPIQLLDCSLYSEIDHTYQAVVEFIKGQNKYICGSCGEGCSGYTYNEDTDTDECNDCKTSNKDE